MSHDMQPQEGYWITVKLHSGLVVVFHVHSLTESNSEVVQDNSP